MLKLSHISCRVDDLHETAKHVQEMGFTIEWGGQPGKENNFFIWFGNGAFLEIFSINRKFAPLVILMQLAYGTIPAKKWWRWFSAKNEWCDFALEEENDKMTKIVRKGGKTIVDIEIIKDYVKRMGIGVSRKTLHWKRKNCRGEYANYSYFIPQNVKLPFIVSRYEPRQKPSNIIHQNGAEKIAYIKIEAAKKEYKDLYNLTKTDDSIIIVKGKHTHICEIGIKGLSENTKICNVILKAMEV